VAGFAVIGVVAVLLLLGLAVGLRRRSQARRPPTDSLPPPNAQEPSALPSGASSTPALPPNQETDAAEPPP
ncbi:MAG TPA: hypothetical protein VGU43_04000, partial [Thermoplasmata archaeon]|nr:hypothetical protein [Thermoplasmata archaeon]